MCVFERAAEVFALLSTPVRLRIVSALCKCEMNVSELLGNVGTSQPNMSQHLSLLYRAGLLGRRRVGTQVFYRVNAESGALLCDAVRSLIGRAVPAKRT
ncbi:MAG: ArsR/SmtB family transcription factor [Polaromonas sp.]